MAYVTPRHYYSTRNRRLRLIVMHTMESPEAGDTAESVANWFAGPTSPIASAHACIDSDSIVLCLPPSATAFAAPGCNADGYQIELAGRAAQGAVGWADAYSQAELRLAAAHARSIAQANGIPLRHLSNAELAAGQSGFIGHVQASQVYRQSNHWDPGPDFPWDQFMSLVRQDDTATPTPPKPKGWLEMATVSELKLAMRAAMVILVKCTDSNTVWQVNLLDSTKRKVPNIKQFGYLRAVGLPFSDGQDPAVLEGFQEVK